MRHAIIAAAIAGLSSAALVAQPGANDARAREIFKQLIEINTTDTPGGNVTRAAEAMAARLKAAGFADADVQVLGPDPRKGNLVARLRGTGARGPILLLAHIDVVEARREDWQTDPFACSVAVAPLPTCHTCARAPRTTALLLPMETRASFPDVMLLPWPSIVATSRSPVVSVFFSP